MNLDKKVCDAHTKPMRSHINVGTGYDISVRELAESISETVGCKGRIEFDEMIGEMDAHDLDLQNAMPCFRTMGMRFR